MKYFRLFKSKSGLYGVVKELHCLFVILFSDIDVAIDGIRRMVVINYYAYMNVNRLITLLLFFSATHHLYLAISCTINSELWVFIINEYDHCSAYK